MKTRILLVLWMTSIYFFANGQSFRTLHFTNNISDSFAGKEKRETLAGQPSIKKINYDFSEHFFYPGTYCNQNSKLQKINGLVLIMSDSMNNAAVIPYGRLGQYAAPDRSYNNIANVYVKKSGNRLAFTTLALMAGSIPRLVAAVKNKKIAGLKFASQKTSFGASNKARKKVTGVTFCIPVGR